LGCARSRNLRGFYEDAGDLGCPLNMVGKLYRQGRQIEVRHVAEVLAGMSDKIPPIGAPR
jgi:L-lactate dehydrogenase complex protein LldE